MSSGGRYAVLMAVISAALPILWADQAFAQGFLDFGYQANGQVLMSAVLFFFAGLMGFSLLIGWKRLMASPEAGSVLATIFGVILAIAVVAGETAEGSSDVAIAGLIAVVTAFVFGVALAVVLFASPPGSIPNVFGSSRWMTRDELFDRRWLADFKEGRGLFLGRTGEGDDIVYRGDMHAMTIAPTRTGKGTTAIIPNLLTLQSSVLVIDPKGENARRTAARRQRMGQKVLIVDPWRISTEPDAYGPGVDPDLIARFNPLDSLDPESPDLATDAMMLADALVIPTGGDNQFWDEEAKGLIFGIILFLITDPEEKKRRNLGRLRQILTLPIGPGTDSKQETLFEILKRMGDSDHELVRASAARHLSKNDREGPGVLSSAQSNTHFLDSPVLRESLAGSDFDFRELKTGEAPVTVYLVLPLDRLATFNRWLRLLVISALKDLMRIPQPAGKPPVRIILDEFAALKQLEMVREAYGTMAGLGVQLWIITQDLGQLEMLYGQAWQTFVGNAGVFQYFGSRDLMSAEYASKLCGETTIKKRSTSSSTSSGGSSESSESVSYEDVSRPLVYADELMTLRRGLELLFIENSYPIAGVKVDWFRDQEMVELQSGIASGARRAGAGGSHVSPRMRAREMTASAQAPLQLSTGNISPGQPEAAEAPPPRDSGKPREPEPIDHAMKKAATLFGVLTILAGSVVAALVIVVFLVDSVGLALFFGCLVSLAAFLVFWSVHFRRHGYDAEAEADRDARFREALRRRTGQAVAEARSAAKTASEKAAKGAAAAKAEMERRRQQKDGEGD